MTFSSTRRRRGADGDPDVAELLGVARVLRSPRGPWSWMLASGPSTARITSARVISSGRLGEPVAAAGAAAGADEAGVLELEQDVLEELERDVLGLGELLALDRLVAGRGQLDGGAHGVVGFRARSSYAPPPMIDLQSHSTVSDGELPPAEVVAAAAEAGVTTLALTDHDAIDGIAEATRRRARSASRWCRRRRCPASTRRSTTCTCSATGSTRPRSRPPASAPSASGVTRAEEIVERLSAQGVPVDLRGRDRARRVTLARSAGPTSPRRRGRSRTTMSAFFEEWLVPRSQGLRLAALADGGRGRRDRSTAPAARPSSPTRSGTSTSPTRSRR